MAAGDIMEEEAVVEAFMVAGRLDRWEGFAAAVADT
jgi:hypothetical protein